MAQHVHGLTKQQYATAAVAMNAKLLLFQLCISLCYTYSNDSAGSLTNQESRDWTMSNSAGNMVRNPTRSTHEAR